VAIETYPFDPAEYLGDANAQAELIADALASGNAGYVAHALGVVARARGMTQLARDTGMSRESLYKALSPQGNPELATVLRVVEALGLKLTAAAA
jgi:probable addiction module antidote protein